MRNSEPNSFFPLFFLCVTLCNFCILYKEYGGAVRSIAASQLQVPQFNPDPQVPVCMEFHVFSRFVQLGFLLLYWNMSVGWLVDVLNMCVHGVLQWTDDSYAVNFLERLEKKETALSRNYINTDRYLGWENI